MLFDLFDQDSMNLPSHTTNIYWLYAYRKTRQDECFYPKDTSRVGKWLIFSDMNIIDYDWEIIKDATEKGYLGNVSKVSTARPNSHSHDSKVGVICVYTYDSDDRNDIMDIRETLYQLGFVNTLCYKTDQTTKDGKYGPGVSEYVI